MDFKAVGAGIQNDLGRLRYVKESERMLLKSERDRTVEDERG